MRMLVFNFNDIDIHASADRHPTTEAMDISEQFDELAAHVDEIEQGG